MNLASLVSHYCSQYEVLSVINLDDWFSFDPVERPTWLHNKISALHRPEYGENQRLLFTLSRGDEYESQDSAVGLILTSLQQSLNVIDISNFFVVLLAHKDQNLEQACAGLSSISTDSVPITVDWFGDTARSEKTLAELPGVNVGYTYNSRAPIKLPIDAMTSEQKDLLLKSQYFCIYPWTHLYVEPNGTTYPCCGSVYKEQFSVGDTKKNSLREIWNSQAIRDIRTNMLNERPSPVCARCYEHEKAGFVSMRISANKHHGHHVDRVKATRPDGHLDDMQMIYWDVRFNNICNLRCRTCGPSFSSSWYQDQIQISPDYAKNHKPLIFAGKYETDLWYQLLEHMDYVEQIYFAGGEPLLMDEHYLILEELERRQKFNVRLIYNTNFNETRLKDRLVFDYWKKFDSVSVGASLDASGARGEYIRKGTDWQEVEHNRRRMMEVCPRVDFYVSATLSILNAWHLPDFHRDWCERGLIAPQDFNINLLVDPDEYRLDIANAEYKSEIKRKYLDHLAWLSPQDRLRRACNGYQSAINFMESTDNSALLRAFWTKTDKMDDIRKENILEAIPELEGLAKNND
jgi:radical SAM protein with 4Fe4S-binding SPASM domain